MATTTTATVRPVPPCSDADCDFYDASCYSCTCPDFAKRNGGSYPDPERPGRTHCKHQARRRQARAEALKARKATELAARAQKNIDRLFFPAPARTAKPASSPYALQLL
jgi:hypothetical protein